eukprot:scaffold76744_cov67-Phaeocystis_antarctica.AAC.11
MHRRSLGVVRLAPPSAAGSRAAAANAPVQSSRSGAASVARPQLVAPEARAAAPQSRARTPPSLRRRAGPESHS